MMMMLWGLMSSDVGLTDRENLTGKDLLYICLLADKETESRGWGRGEGGGAGGGVGEK